MSLDAHRAEQGDSRRRRTSTEEVAYSYSGWYAIGNEWAAMKRFKALELEGHETRLIMGRGITAGHAASTRPPVNGWFVHHGARS